MQKHLLEQSAKYPIVSVIGPRQSGKTTLVRNTFTNMDYASLEDPDTWEFSQTDPRGFLAIFKNGAIFDETQRAPHLFSCIQTLVDVNQEAGQFILTGSNNCLLQENISQTLAGRVAILKLLPLSLEELKYDNFPINKIEEYIFKGFYPRIYNHQLDPCNLVCKLYSNLC